MFQRLYEADRRADQRAAVIEVWRTQLRDYDDAVDEFHACLTAVETRSETRADNQRENQSDMNFIDIMDRWLDVGADPALSEARLAELADAQLDDSERPSLNPEDCDDPGPNPPAFPPPTD